MERREHDEAMIKFERLKEKIAERGKLLVAFSGGVDSGLLTKVSYDVLGENALAVTLSSEIFSRAEMRDAIRFLEDIGIRYRVIGYPWMENEGFVRNERDRCYHCKKDFARILRRVADEEGIETIAEGVNLSDLDEHRPGITASREEKIFHPFVEVAITKTDIRIIAREIGLSIWDKPSMACLATRIQYGEKITVEKLRMIDEAEEFLRNLGFKQLRVRLHGGIARVEFSKDELPMCFDMKMLEKISKKLKSLGFDYVTLDIEGYRSGSMDKIEVKG